MKKIIAIAVALVAVLTFTGVALAAEWSSTRSWSSGSCYDYFYTGTISKPGGLWDGFYITATSINYTPSGGYEAKLFARPYSSGGNVMGAQTTCTPGVQKVVSCTQNESQTDVKLRIENYYGPDGPSMASAGSFYGHFS